MKEITVVTPNGITYIDEEGDQQFIDFYMCQQNNIKTLRRQSWWNEKQEEFYQRAKYVGIRVTFRDPPAIEFYTVPRVYFEFPIRDRLYEVASLIKQAGWRTHDGD